MKEKSYNKLNDEEKNEARVRVSIRKLTKSPRATRFIGDLLFDNKNS